MQVTITFNPLSAEERAAARSFIDGIEAEPVSFTLESFEAAPVGSECVQKLDGRNAVEVVERPKDPEPVEVDTLDRKTVIKAAHALYEATNDPDCFDDVLAEFGVASISSAAYDVLPGLYAGINAKLEALKA